jgi:hypothetical protein
MTQFEFHAEYSAFLTVDSPEAIIGHIDHVQPAGELSRAVSVAYFHACIAPATEWSGEHYDVRLFIRSTIRYDATSHITTVVGSPERQSGSNREELQRLRALAEGDLEPVHPDMPSAFAQGLLSHSCCREPMFLSLYYAAEIDGLEFGDVLGDD